MTPITQTTALWFASRATGVVSLVMLSLVVILGVLVNRRGRLPGLPAFVVTGLHRNLSLLSVAFVAIHVATAVADPYVTIRALAIVVPFTSAYLPFWLGLGAVALDLMLALIATSLIRARLTRRTWRGVHWLAYGAWPVAFAHGLGASPDLRFGGLREIAIGCALAVGAALLARLAMAMGEAPRAERAALALSSALEPRDDQPAGAGNPAHHTESHLADSGHR